MVVAAEAEAVTGAESPLRPSEDSLTFPPRGAYSNTEEDEEEEEEGCAEKLEGPPMTVRAGPTSSVKMKDNKNENQNRIHVRERRELLNSVS